VLNIFAEGVKSSSDSALNKSNGYRHRHAEWESDWHRDGGGLVSVARIVKEIVSIVNAMSVRIPLVASVVISIIIILILITRIPVVRNDLIVSVFRRISVIVGEFGPEISQATEAISGGASEASRMTFIYRRFINHRLRRRTFWRIVRDIGNRFSLTVKDFLIHEDDGRCFTWLASEGHSW
jgi:hypothetical protein